MPFKRSAEKGFQMTNKNRETWLNEFAAKAAPHFEALGKPLPPFRVAVGFVSTGKDGGAIGECWSNKCSADNHFEIFIRPDAQDTRRVAFVLVHELTHAAVGLGEGHKGEFARVALALGLPRPLTNVGDWTPRMHEWLDPIIAETGEIPHAPLTWRDETGHKTAGRGKGGVEREDGDGDDEPKSSRKKKQGTRLHKAACPECGYTVRVTQKWLEIGVPHCPVHGAMQLGDDE
jgi:hypothetical protein